MTYTIKTTAKPNIWFITENIDIPFGSIFDSVAVIDFRFDITQINISGGSVIELGKYYIEVDFPVIGEFVLDFDYAYASKVEAMYTHDIEIEGDHLRIHIEKEVCVNAQFIFELHNHKITEFEIRRIYSR